MNAGEKQQSLEALVKLLHDNAGNRITLALMNGLSITHGQFLDTLLKVEEPTNEVDHAISS